jgi:hypothetical protein
VLIFLGSDERVEELELDEDPTHLFQCMPASQFDREARAQLYSLVTNSFLEDAAALEVITRSLDDEGPWIYRLDRALLERLASLDEDEIGKFAELWFECEQLEALEPELDDLHEFMYQLVSFCQAACNEADLGVFVYSNS